MIPIISAASILRPFISEKNYWILQHHEVEHILWKDYLDDHQFYAPPNVDIEYISKYQFAVSYILMDHKTTFGPSTTIF